MVDQKDNTSVERWAVSMVGWMAKMWVATLVELTVAMMVYQMVAAMVG